MKRIALSLFAALCVSAPSFADDWIPLQDGMFVSGGERSPLFYDGKVAKHEFRNFELSVEVMTSPS